MKRVKKMLMLIISVILLISLQSIVSAAGSFSISASNSLTVGKTTNLTIKTTNAEGKFSITSSNPNVVSVGTASTWVSSSESIVLTAKSAGKATITVTPVSVSDTDLNLITGAKSVIITVSSNNTQPNPPPNPQPNQPSAPKSGDATLKSITIGGKTYSGSSLKSTISHTVGSTVNSIKINAVKNNSKATVGGTGTKNLEIGKTNKFAITVTAENGTKKTYNINIIRLAEESTVPNIIDEEQQEPVQEKLMLTSLTIKDVELSPEFNSEVYSYVTNVKNLKELEIDAAASNADAQINIEGATDLKEGYNIVKIIVTLDNERIEYVINVYNTIENEIIGVTEDNDNDASKNFEKDNTKEILLIILSSVLGLIAIRYIILSYILSKKFDDSRDDILLDEEEEDLQIKNQNIAIQTGKVGRHF